MTETQTALLIIDVQNSVLGENLETYHAYSLLQNIENLIKKARSTNTPIIYIQHEEGNALEPETPGWQIHPKIAPKKGDIRIRKHHPDSFHDTLLEEELKRLHVNKLIIVGLQTEWCIDSTVRRAYSLRFDVTVVEDGHSTRDSSILEASKIIEHHNLIFGGRFAKLRKERDIDFR